MGKIPEILSTLLCLFFQIFFFLAFFGVFLFKKPLQRWIKKIDLHFNMASIMMRYAKYKVLTRIVIAYLISMFPVFILGKVAVEKGWVFAMTYLFFAMLLFLVAIPTIFIFKSKAKKEKNVELSEIFISMEDR